MVCLESPGEKPFLYLSRLLCYNRAVEPKVKKEPCRGTRDFFPPEERVRTYVFDKMRAAAESFGYEPYDGPLVEEEELYRAKSGDELVDRQLYSFTDRGGRRIAIRPEMTPTLARMVARIHREQPKPLRWYSIPNLMRYEKPQRGRLREHWQLNADIFGAGELHGELEILQLARRFLESFGADDSHFEILVNDRRFVDHIFQKTIGASKEQSRKLYKIVDKAKKFSPAALGEALDEVGLGAKAQEKFLAYLDTSSFEGAARLAGAHPCAEALRTLIARAKTIGLDPYLAYDPAVIRGVDYYTGIVFEIFDKSPDNRRAICGGGAYQNLLEIFGENPLPGVGFGLGDVTLTHFLQGHKLLPDLSLPSNDLFVSFQETGERDAAAVLAENIRSQGCKVVFAAEPVKIKKAISSAQRWGAHYLALVGEGGVQIKNIACRTEQAFDLKDAAKIAKSMRHEKI